MIRPNDGWVGGQKGLPANYPRWPRRLNERE